MNVNNNQQVTNEAANREVATLTTEGMLSSGAWVGSAEGTSTWEPRNYMTPWKYVRLP